MNVRIKKTGEIIYLPDISKSSLDGYGVSLEDIEIQFNHKSKKYDTIDWEQRRYELAKAAMQSILSNDNSQAIAMNPNDDNCKEYPTGIAQYAVACADALIEELKKE